MPLQRVETETTREMHGFAFPMRIVGSLQNVRVFVSDEALVALRPMPDQRELRAQLESERAAFEALANEKYTHGQVTAEGEVMITLCDVVGFFQ